MTFLLKTRAVCCMGLLDRDVSLTRHRVHGCSKNRLGTTRTRSLLKNSSVAGMVSRVWDG
jgi:hypothetical protein